MGKVRKSPDEMTFLEHLEDLRKRLFNSVIALLIAVFPAWFFAKDLYRIIAYPLEKYLPEGTRLAYGTLSAPFMIYMKTAFIAALFFMSPFIFLQLWYFIAPGLYQKEKKFVVPFVLMTFPEVFSPVPPLMILFISLSTILTSILPSDFLLCLANECGTDTGFSDITWARLLSAISIPSSEYLPNSLSINITS